MAKGGMLSKSSELRPSFDVERDSITIGIDLGDRYSYCCVLRGDGQVLTEGRVRTTAEGLAKHFQNIPQTRIAMEVGTHSLLGQSRFIRMGARSHCGEPPSDPTYHCGEPQERSAGCRGPCPPSAR